MKGVLLILFSMSVAVCFGQLKHDANWVFGYNSGIDFNNPLFPIPLTPICQNLEPNASISDSAGNFQLYLSYSQTGGFVNASIKDFANHIILNGDGISVNSSATNGAVFCYLPDTEDTMLLFHIGQALNNCIGAECSRLFCTTIKQNNNREWEVIDKNRMLDTTSTEESIALMKHADGKGWWIFVHAMRSNSIGSSSNTFLEFEIGNLSQSSLINTNAYHRDQFSFVGEVVAIKGSNFFLDVVAGDNIVFLNKIDRCNGEIMLVDSININVGNFEIYSAVKTRNYIYIAYTVISGSASGGGGISQYFLANDTITDMGDIFFENNTYYTQGQLELGLDGNIWVSHSYQGLDTSLQRKFQKHLSVIKFPDTDTALYVPYFFYVGDSAITGIGLPSFPDYNLGPEGVFLANAGKDTVLCSNTNSTGLTIGAPPVPNVTYLWQPATGLSATNTAQPTASPTQSTWYYLTATDTTATSCAVNTDSVFVKVRTCTGITETPTLQAKLYPNPTNGLLTVEVPQGKGGYTFRLFNLLGQQVLEHPLEHDKTTFPLDFAKGIYLYQITAHNGQVQHGKLVIGD